MKPSNEPLTCLDGHSVEVIDALVGLAAPRLGF